MIFTINGGSSDEVVGKNDITGRVFRHWNKLPRWVVESLRACGSVQEAFGCDTTGDYSDAGLKTGLIELEGLFQS